MNILLSRSRVKSATNYNEVRFPDNGLRIFFMNISDHYSFLLSWLIIFFLSAVSTPSTAQKAVVYGTITDDTSGDIARIKNGTDKIDPDYCIRFDKTEIGGLNGLKGEFLSTILYGGNGKLYAYANIYALDPNAMTNPYVCLSNVPVVIDLARKTVERIEGMEISNPQGIAIGKYKDLIVFGSANKKANGFYTYRPETKEVKGPVMQVQGNPSLFYSYVR